jgi:DNA polymerase-1
MAHVSNDANLQRAFAAGEDIHKATASEVFGVSLQDVSADQRRAAKAINFGLIYGMGAFGLASNLGITRDAAQSYIDRYFTRYPGVAQYMAETRALAIRRLGSEGQTVLPLDEAVAALVAEAVPPDLARGNLRG